MNEKRTLVSPHLLWEYNLDTFDYINSKSIVIERVIERGNLEDWKSIFKAYGKEALLEVVYQSKQLSKRDKDFTLLFVNSPLINVA